jgi:hypothetical protein
LVCALFVSVSTGISCVIAGQGFREWRDAAVEHSVTQICVSAVILHADLNRFVSPVALPECFSRQPLLTTPFPLRFYLEDSHEITREETEIGLDRMGNILGAWRSEMKIGNFSREECWT